MFCFSLTFLTALTVVLANPIPGDVNDFNDLSLDRASTFNSDDTGNMLASSTISPNEDTVANSVPVTGSRPGCTSDASPDSQSDDNLQKRFEKNVCPVEDTPTNPHPTTGKPKEPLKKTEYYGNPCKGSVTPYYVSCGGSEVTSPQILPLYEAVLNCVPGKSFETLLNCIDQTNG